MTLTQALIKFVIMSAVLAGPWFVMAWVTRQR